MSHDEIDRALREDERIEPSGEFTARVMRGVHQEVEELEAIRFPWSRVLPGLGACLLGMIALAFVSPSAAVPAWFDPRVVEGALDRVLQVVPAASMAMTLGSLVGSWLLVRFSLRVCGN